MDKIRVTKQTYAKSPHVNHGMLIENSARTPLPKDAGLLPAHQYERLLSITNQATYRSGTGGLLYLAVYTRPDLSLTGSALAQNTHAPTECHYALLHRTIQYVAGPLSRGLSYPLHHKLQGNFLWTYADADWGDAKREDAQPLRTSSTSTKP